MIAKITKGANFAGVLRYILNPDKQTELLDASGVRLKDMDTIIQSFERQKELNPRISKPVGHISLDFSAQDSDKLTNEVMVKIARDYMKRMGITDTQYIISRHHDKDHPHIHIAYNRIDNNGNTITDRNDRFRSEKICKELTAQYGLYFAPGKENVKQHRLREPDKTKYEIYNALKTAVPQSRNWEELTARLQREGIETTFKNKGTTSQVEGVKFSKNGYHFNGSQIDREFSYSRIDFRLSQNARQEKTQDHTQQTIQSFPDNSAPLFGNLFGGLFQSHPGNNPDEEEFQRRMRRKKKKKRGISR